MKNMKLLQKSVLSDVLCRQILSVDKAINFVSIITEQGRVLESRTRDCAYFNLPDDKREVFFMEFALRQRMRSEFDDCFGSVSYTCAEREKDVFLSFPLDGIGIIVSCKTGIDSRLLAKKILDIIDIWKNHDLTHAGDHTLRIYDDDEMQMNELLSYLKDGLDRNETVMLLLDDDMPKNKIQEKISRELDVDVQHLETNDKIILRSVSEWFKPIDSFDPQKIIVQLEALVSFVKMKGSNGLRVFEDTTSFFKGGFSKKLVQYELYFLKNLIFR